MFLGLPALVQWKILRQYIPTLFKASTLSHMPEFSRALGCEQSWSNETRRFKNFFDMLRLLRPGVYIQRRYREDDDADEAWEHGYLVWTDDEKITFRLFCAYEDRDPFAALIFKQCYNIPVCLDHMRHFLNEFFKSSRVIDDPAVSVYRLEGHGCFFVDHSRNLVRWTDGRHFEMKENKCFVRENPAFTHWELTAKENRVVLVECRYARVQNLSCECARVRSTLEPLTPESPLFDPADVRRRNTRNVCRVTFRVVGDERLLADYVVSNVTSWKYLFPFLAFSPARKQTSLS